MECICKKQSQNVYSAVVKVDDSNNKELQKDEKLIPGKWLTSKGHEDLIAELSQAGDNENAQTFEYFSQLKQRQYNELYSTLDLCIDQVTEELAYDRHTEHWIDEIDKAVIDIDFENNCQKCHKIIDILNKCVLVQMLKNNHQSNFKRSAL